jgi:hypothetical protein
MGGQNGPQADTDAMRHPRHSETAQSQSADDTTANQTTQPTTVGVVDRHDGKANDDEGSPRMQPPAHIRTLAMH